LLLNGATRYGIAILLAGLAVAWARVFVGVHFPLDMAGAVIVASVALFLLTPFWSLFGASATRGLVVVYRKLLAVPIGRGWLAR
jgi:undecaprenyl-diphosphatase